MVCGISSVRCGLRSHHCQQKKRSRNSRAEQQSSAAATISASAAPQQPPRQHRHFFPEAVPSPGEKTLWLLMAACGSLLLSAVTSHLSQNIAAIPLLWILPLTIYLLTFVLAFNGKLYWRWLMVRLLAVALGALGYFIAKPSEDLPIAISIPFFCLSLVYRCLFLPRRALPAPAVCALSHAVLSAHCGGRCAGIDVCRRARADGL